MKVIFLFLVAIVSLNSQLFSQSNPAHISGYVYDQANGEAIIGANVYIEGESLGSSTNHSGYYVIPQILPGEYILITDYLGFKTDKKKSLCKKAIM